MRTTTLTWYLATLALSTGGLVAAGCAPIGSPGGHRDTTDAGSGSTDSSCDDSNITTTSQSINFSGDAPTGMPTGCWKLTGTLTVASSVASLAKLGDLRGVTNLVIKGTDLTAIDTPNPLAVDQAIDIENNTKLTDLTNLSVPTDSSGTTCTTYIQSLNLTGNTAITDVGALNNLRCVSGATTITGNTALTTLDLSNAIRLEGGLTISGNTALTTLQLTNLYSATGTVAISNNAALTSLGTWGQLAFIHGGLTVDTNAALTSLAGVFTQTQAASVAIEGNLAVTNNKLLVEVGEFAYLGSAVMINVSNNAALTYCEAREIGCCVLDSEWDSVAGATISGDKGNSCGTESWCYKSNGTCSNAYTGYSGPNPSGQSAGGGNQ